MKRLPFALLVLVAVFFGSYGLSYAVTTVITSQGGTGTTTPSGILYGDNGSTTHLNTVIVGTGLSFSGGTLSNTGGSGNVATSSVEQANQVAVFSSNAATPALIDGSNNFIFDGTNVGIGTTTPYALLSVSNSATSAANGTLFSVASTTLGTATTTVFTVTAGNSVTNITAPAAGTGLTIGGVTTGTGISITSLSGGTALNCTVTNNGKCLKFNSTGATLATGAALQVTGTANETVDYTGAFVDISPGRNVAAAATRTHSGNIFQVTPTYSTSGANASVQNVTGTTSQFARTFSNGSSNGSAAINVSAPNVAISDLVNVNTGVSITGALLSLVENATSSATNTLLTVSNMGNGNLATFTGNGNFGIGSSTPGSLLSVGGNGTGWNFYDNATSTKSGVGGINIAGGCFAINGVCVGGSGTVTSIIAGNGLNGGTITSTGQIDLKSYIATSSLEVQSNLAYWTTSSGNPAKLGTVATTSVTCSGFLTCTGFSALGAASTITTTGQLSIASGGTNNSSFVLGNIWFDGTKIAATSSAFTVGSLIATTTATSTLAGGLTIKGTESYPFNTPGFTIQASTTASVPFPNSTSTIQLPSSFSNQKLDAYQCYTDIGTLEVTFGTGSATTTYANASTTQGVITTTTNNTFTPAQKRYLAYGNPASSASVLTCSLKIENTSY